MGSRLLGTADVPFSLDSLLCLHTVISNREYSCDTDFKFKILVILVCAYYGPQDFLTHLTVDKILGLESIEF